MLWILVCDFLMQILWTICPHFCDITPNYTSRELDMLESHLVGSGDSRSELSGKEIQK